MRRVYTSLLTLAVCAPAFGAFAADLGGSFKDGGGAPADEWAISGAKVGGILIVQPKYEGSKEYEVLGLPYILPIFANGGGGGFFSRIDARGVDDVRFNLIEREGFVAGPLAGYSFGREDNDGDLLRGLGDIDGGLVVGGFVGYRLGPVLFDVSYHQYLDDSEGYQIRFGAEAERRISDHVTLTGRIGATYADDNYMQTYFGVSDAQALNSDADLDASNAEAGFKDVNVEVGIKADLDDRWSAKASVRYSHLLGDAGDSEVVESDDQFMGLVGLSYKFYSER